MIEALGLIETYGLIGAVEAADTGLKAANVKLIGLKVVGGGLVTVMLTGDVGSVRAAVDAAGAAAEKIGTVRSTHVMPRPFDEVHSLCGTTFGNRESELNVEQESPVEEITEEIPAEEEAVVEEIAEEVIAEEVIAEEVIAEEVIAEEVTDEEALKDKYSKMNVKDLRKIARRIDDLPVEKSGIQFIQRQELINVLVEYFKNKTKN